MDYLLIIGFIWIVIYLFSSSSSKKHGNKPLNQWGIANLLENLAKKPEYSNDAETYKEIVRALRTGKVPKPTGPGSKAEKDEVIDPNLGFADPHFHEDQAAEEPASKILDTKTVKAPTPSGVEAPTPQPVPQAAHASSTPAVFSNEKVIDPAQVLQNINVLLFAGAILVVGSLAAIVNANFDSLSAGTRLLIGIVFIVSFYGSGLVLYKKPKFKPAGITFTSIGMVSLPLFGLAIRRFVFPDANPDLVWFIISAVSLASYGLTMRVIKHWAVESSMLLALIATAQTSILTADGPLYALAWAGVALSSAFRLYEYRSGKYDESLNPPRFISAALAHISVGYSLYLWASQEEPLYQVWLSLALISIYYLVNSLVEQRYRESAKAWLFMSLTSFGAASAIFVFDIWGSRVGASLVLFVQQLIALIVFMQSLKAKKGWLSQVASVFMSYAVLASVAVVLVWPTLDTTAYLLLAQGLTFIGATVLSRDHTALTMALIWLGLTPLALGGLTFEANDVLVTSLGYSALTLLTLLTYPQLKDENFRDQVRSAFTAYAALGVIATIFVPGQLGAPLIMLGLSVMLLISAYYEDKPENLPSRYAATIAASTLSILLWKTSDTALYFVLVHIGYLGLAWQLTKHRGFMFSALFWVLVVPGLLGFLTLDAANTTRFITVSYTYLGYGFLSMALQSLKPEQPHKILNAVHIISHALAVVFSLSAGVTHAAIIMSVVGVSMFYTSIVKKEYELQYFSHVLFFTTLAILKTEFDWSIGYATLAMFYGIGSYSAHILFNPLTDRTADIFKDVALIGLAFGVFNSSSSGLGVLSLVLLSVALIIEAMLKQSYKYLYAGLSALTIAINWILILNDVTTIYAHAIVWGSFTSLLAYIESKFKKQPNDELVIASLALYTIPLALQVISTGDSSQSILLLFISTMILVIGLLMQRDIAWKWGLVAVGLEVVYQTRDLIADIPRQLVSFILGLLLLGAAVYYLNKRNTD